MHVCTENLIRIDCVTESPNVNGDDGPRDGFQNSLKTFSGGPDPLQKRCVAALSFRIVGSWVHEDNDAPHALALLRSRCERVIVGPGT